MMALWETGLIDFWTHEVFNIRGAEKCLAPPDTTPKLVPIKLIDLTSAFFILGTGIRVSVLVFLIELIVSKYKREIKFKNKNSPSSAVVIVTTVEIDLINSPQNYPLMIVEESASVEVVKIE